MVERVALVSPYDYAKHGGVTEHVRQLAAQLRRRELDVTVLAPSSEPAVDEPGLLSLGTVMQIPINGSVARTTISPVMLEKAGALLARTRYDVIHLHEPLAPMLPLSMLNASPSAPNVGTFHASGERSLAYASSRRLLGWLAQRLAVRVAVSPQAAAFARRYIGGEYTIIPNGVETDRFRPTGPLFAEWHAGPPTLLFVGRFEEPRKGFAVLLEAFAHLQRTRPDVRLLVVGRGDPAPFQARASELELRNIHFAGPASADELPRYYRSADVLCAPSTGQESFGIILVEAMSSGLPIVAADIPGYAGVMTHRQEGLLVPPSNPDAFAAALLHLLADRTLRLRCAAEGVATAQDYAWSDVSERILDVYERAQAAFGRSGSEVLAPARPGSEVLASAPPQKRHPVALPESAAEEAIAMPAAGVQFRHNAFGHDIQGVPDMLTEPFEARIRAVTQRVVGRVLGRTPISPNMLTVVGLLLTLAVTATLASGHLVWGGILVLLTSAFDMFDGALARATKRNSVFGAFFDSTVDRYAEALVFFGLLLYFQGLGGHLFELSMVYLTIVGSLMVSYTRARAESLGVECKVGLLARPERVILLSLGLIIGWLPFTLAVLAIFTNVTAVQRIYHVWTQTDGKARSKDVVKPRRGWFSARDQSPS